MDASTSFPFLICEVGGGKLCPRGLIFLKAHKGAASENTFRIKKKTIHVGREGNSHARQRSGESLGGRHLLAPEYVTGGPVKVYMMLLTGTNACNDTLSKNIYHSGLSRCTVAAVDET